SKVAPAAKAAIAFLFIILFPFFFSPTRKANKSQCGEENIKRAFTHSINGYPPCDVAINIPPPRLKKSSTSHTC
ncbi:hypothetical protein QP427_06765, partial [Bifidobacterium sp. UMB1230]|nr:hypothetical protein [Bifidobacterium sp. UMB1230]